MTIEKNCKKVSNIWDTTAAKLTVYENTTITW